MVFAEQPLQRIESQRWRGDGIRQVQKFMKNIQCERQHFTDSIIFISMFDKIKWGENDNTEECHQNSAAVGEICSQISSRSLVFPGTWTGKDMVQNLF